MEDVGGHRRRIVVARAHAHDRLVVLARVEHLVVLLRGRAEGGEEGARHGVARGRRRRGVGDLLALQVGDRLDAAVLAHDEVEVKTVRAVVVGADGEGHGTGDVDRVVGGAGGEEGKVQAARAHRLDLRRVGLHREEHRLLARALGEVFDEGVEHPLIDRRVFERREREDQGVRVLEFLGVAGRVGDEVLVRVAVHQVELAAIGTGVLRLRRQLQAQHEQAEQTKPAKPRQAALAFLLQCPFHSVFPLLVRRQCRSATP